MVGRTLTTVTIVCLFMATTVRANPFTFSYAGRLADGQNVGIPGPINLQLNFYNQPTGGTIISGGTASYAGVNLSDGVFQVDLSQMSAQEVNLVFGTGNDVWVEVVDQTHGVTYPRQRLSAIPYALKIPVDGSTVTYNSQGNLTVITAGGGTAPAADGIVSLDNSARLPAVDGSQLTNVTVSSVGGASAGAVAAAAKGFQTAASVPVANSLVLRDGNGNLSGNLLLGAALRLGAGSNSITLSVPTSFAGNASYQLPGAPIAGAFLSTDGSGNMSWGIPVGGITTIQTIPPLAMGNSAGSVTLSMGQASGSTSGYLGNLDWTKFSAMLPLTGGTMTGSLNLGTQALANTGTISMATGKLLALSGNTTDPTGLTTANKGNLWFNSTANQIRYFDGTTVQTVGAAGGGITSLNGLTSSSQTFANSTSGTSPTFTSTGSVHTLNMPMASGSSVTAGLLSNSDYTTFSSKVGGVTAGTGMSSSTAGGNVTVGLNPTGVGAGTYTKITVNALGQATAGTALTTSDLPAVNATNIVGVLPVSNGGTGFSTGNPGGIPYFATSGSMASSSVLPAGGILIGAGGGNAPTTVGPLASGQVLIGSGATPVAATLTAGNSIAISSGSGSITISSTVTPASYVATAGSTMSGALTLPINGLVAGSGQLVLSNGNVGVGSTAPSATLDVNGSLALASLLGHNTTASANDSFILGTTAQNTFYIDRPNGSPYTATNIAFGYNGVTPASYGPTFTLYNNQTDHTPLFQTYSRAAGGGPNGVTMYPAGFSSTSGVAIGTANPAAGFDFFSSSGRHGFTISSTYGNVGIGTTSTTGVLDVRGMGGSLGVLVDVNGNVGIGTSTPNALFHASVPIAIFGPGEGATPSTALLRGPNAAGTNIAGGNLTFQAGNGTGTGGSGGMQFLVAPIGTSSSTADSLTAAMVVTPSGYVGIGTSNPSYTLHVNGSVAGVGAYNQLSDARYKKDVQDLAGSLAKVLAIRGVTYKWIDEGKYGSDTQIGVLAQEIEQIVPEVVSVGNDGVKRVRYTDLIPLVIAALKEEHNERDNQISALTARVAAAEAEAAQFKADNQKLAAFLCAKFPDAPSCAP